MVCGLTGYLASCSGENGLLQCETATISYLVKALANIPIHAEILSDSTACKRAENDKPSPQLCLIALKIAPRRLSKFFKMMIYVLLRSLRIRPLIPVPSAANHASRHSVKCTKVIRFPLQMAREQLQSYCVNK